MCVNKVFAKILTTRESFLPPWLPRGSSHRIQLWCVIATLERTNEDIAQLHPREKTLAVIIFHPCFALLISPKK